MKSFDLQTLASLNKQSESKIYSVTDKIEKEKVKKDEARKKENYYQYLGSSFKKNEDKDIEKLLTFLIKSSNSGLDTSGFYFDFKIPQISKEFDLLRFSKGQILNIELKSGNKSEEDIRKQLVKNKYYLTAFDGGHRQPHLYTFVSSSNDLFELTDKDQLIKANTNELISYINYPSEKVDFENICNVNDYLISPFNNTERFLKSEYFLTDQQQQIRKEIISHPNTNYFIEGTAGTGKTLLTYDIAKHFINENQKCLVVHCANLNEGQEYLNIHGWNIHRVKDINTLFSLKDYKVIIVDEVQRIHDSALDCILNFKGQIIFSGDRTQWLNTKEDPDKVINLLKANNVKKLKLTGKIRNNEEISCFIKHLFKIDSGTKDYPKSVKFKNIYLEFFDSNEQVIKFAHNLSSKNWTIINLATSMYNKEFYDAFSDISNYKTHQVIGQEFDKVATFIGPNFRYENDNLTGYDTYYPATKTLFENLTRTKTSLLLIIINNKEVFDQCIDIINMS